MKHKKIIISFFCLACALLLTATGFAIYSKITDNDVSDLKKVSEPVIKEKEISKDISQNITATFPNGVKKDLVYSMQEKEYKLGMATYRITEQNIIRSFIDVGIEKKNPDIKLSAEKLIPVAKEHLEQTYKEYFDGYVYTSYDSPDQAYVDGMDKDQVDCYYYIYFNKFYGKENFIKAENARVYMYSDGTIYASAVADPSEYKDLDREKLNSITQKEIEDYTKNQVYLEFNEDKTHTIKDVHVLKEEDKFRIVINVEIEQPENYYGVSMSSYYYDF